MPSRPAVEVLKASPIFAGLPAREIDALAAVAREEAYRPRDFVFMEGDPAAWVCIVDSGHVKILRQSRTGRDVMLELLGPGEIFGRVAAIERRPYPAAAQATETSVALILSVVHDFVLGPRAGAPWADPALRVRASWVARANMLVVLAIVVLGLALRG